MPDFEQPGLWELPHWRDRYVDPDRVHEPDCILDRDHHRLTPCIAGEKVVRWERLTPFEAIRRVVAGGPPETEDPRGGGCRHPYPTGGPRRRCPYCGGELAEVPDA